jgi:hypothetical protein
MVLAIGALDEMQIVLEDHAVDTSGDGDKGLNTDVPTSSG